MSGRLVRKFLNLWVLPIKILPSSPRSTCLLVNSLYKNSFCIIQFQNQFGVNFVRAYLIVFYFKQNFKHFACYFDLLTRWQKISFYSVIKLKDSWVLKYWCLDRGWLLTINKYFTFRFYRRQTEDKWIGIQIWKRRIGVSNLEKKLAFRMYDSFPIFAIFASCCSCYWKRVV